MRSSHLNPRTLTASILVVALSTLNLALVPLASAAVIEGGPSVAFLSDSPFVIEDKGSVVLTVTLDPAVPDSSVIVTATTADGTGFDGNAIEDEDYAGFDQDIVIPAGETSKDIVVTILDDNDGDIADVAVEMFTVTLSEPRLQSASSSPAPTLGSPAVTTVEIRDDDIAARDDHWDDREDLTLVTNMNTNLSVEVDDGVLDNDDNREDDNDDDVANRVTANSVAAPAGNNVLVNPDGSFDFQPSAGYVGEVTFSYTVSDNSDVESADVTMRVNGLVTANADEDYTVGEDGSIDTAVDELASVLANDDDGEPEPQDTLTVTPFDATSAEGGSVAMGTDGHFTYEPAEHFNGTDTFGYTVSDGYGSSAEATVTITVAPVNDAPSFTFANPTVDEDSGPASLPITAISAGPANEDQTVSFAISDVIDPESSNPELFTQGGQPAIAISGTDVTFTPAPNAVGSASFVLTATDTGPGQEPDENTTSQTVTVTVGALNDPPEFTLLPVTIDEDSAAQAVAEGEWLTDVTDVEDVRNSTFAVTANTNEALFSALPTVTSSEPVTETCETDFGHCHYPSLEITDGICFDEGPGTVFCDGPLEGEYTYSGCDMDTIGEICVIEVAAAAENVLAYTPAPNTHGSATITVTATDDHGTPDNLDDDVTTSHDLLITVNAVNDAPNVTPVDQPAIDEDPGQVTVPAVAFEDGPAWTSLLDDGDPTDDPADNQTLRFALSSVTPDVDTPLTFTEPEGEDPGGAPTVDPTTGTITYTPALHANGSATLTIVVTDDNATPDNPDDDQSTTVEVTITVGAVNDKPNVTPVPQFVDEDAGDVAVPAVAVEDGPAWTSLLDDGDPELDETLTFSGGDVVEDPENPNPVVFTETGTPAVSSTGVLTFEAEAHDHGSFVVAITVTDDNATPDNPDDDQSTTVEVTITVNAVNDAPNVTPVDQPAIDEDPGQVTVPAVAFEDGPAWTSLLDDGDPTDDPADNQTLRFALSSVTPDVDTPLTFTEPEGEDPGGAPTVDPTTGTITYTPALHANGSATLTIVVTDDNATPDNPDDDQSTTVEVTITVGAVNDKPNVTPVPQFVDEDAGDVAVPAVAVEDGPAWTSLLDDGDPELDETLTFSGGDVVEDPENPNPVVFTETGAPAVSSTGVLTFEAEAHDHGSFVVAITVTDDNATPDNPDDDQSTTVEVTITVNAVNDAPNVTPVDQPAIDEDPGQVTVPAVAFEDGPAWTSLLDDGDPTDDPADNQTLRFALSSVTPDVDTPLTFTEPEGEDPGGAPTVDPTTGTITYTPALHANGSATLTIVVTDDNATPDNPDDDQSTTVEVTITVGAVNDKPNVTPVPQFVDEDAGDVAVPAVAVEDGPAWTSLLDDGDPELDETLTFSGGDVVEDPENPNPVVFTETGAPAVSSTGVLTFEAEAHDHGSFVVAITVTDDNATPDNPDDDQSTTVEVTITVNAVNDAPNVTPVDQPAIDEDPGQVTVPAVAFEDGPAWTSLLDDGDPTDDPADNQTLRFALSSVTPDVDTPLTFTEPEGEDPGGAPTVDPTTGTITYTPALHANGSATLTIVVTDDNATPDNPDDDQSTTVEVTITVGAVNDKPNVTPVPQFVDEDAGDVAVPAVAVEDGPAWTSLLDDGDPELDETLTFSGGDVVEDPENPNPVVFTETGAPAVSSTGVLTFEAEAHDHGSFVVAITVTDDNATPDNPDDDQSTTVEVTITVNAVNDAPNVTPVDQPAIDEDPGQVTVPAVAFEDGPAWTSLLDDGDPTDDPADNQTLRFALSSVTPDVDTPLTFTEPEGEDPGGAPTVDPTTGTITYTPALHANGSATLTIVVTDDNATPDNPDDDQSTTVEVTITVGAVDDPEVALPDAYVVDVDDDDTNEDDVNLSVDAEDGVLANDLAADPDGDSLRVTGWTIPTSGAVSLLPDGALEYDADPFFIGTATFQYTMTDDIGVGTSSATVTLTVNAPPTRADEDPIEYIADENTGLDDYAGLEIDVSELTARFEDVADTIDDEITFDSAGQPGEGEGSVDVDEGENGEVVIYTPAEGFIGTATFTIVVTDGRLTTDETVTIRVNAAPDTTDDEDSVLEEGSLSIDPNVLIANDTDTADAITTDAVTFVGIDEGPEEGTLTPEDNGTYTYVPALDFVGEDSFTYEVTDGRLSAYGTVDLTVGPVNDAPEFTLPGNPDQIVEDAEAVTVESFYTAEDEGGGSDEDTQELTLVVTTTNGALFAEGGAPAISQKTGELTFETATNANGSATVTVSLSDNGGTEDGGADTTEATFTILVTEVNDAPVFTLPEDADQTVAEDAGAQSVANFYTAAGPGGGDDENTQELTLDVTTTNGALFAVAPAIDDETGALTYTPADNANGSATVTVSLSDNGTTNGEPAGETTEATFTITVTEVNDAPVFTLPEDADQTVAEDAGAQSVANFYTAAGPGGGDDENTQELALDVTTTNGALFAVAPAIDDETGALTYTPAGNANGSATVTVSLSDNGTTNGEPAGETTEATFTITVTEVNDAPVFTLPEDADQTVLEDAGAQSVANFYTAAGPGGGDDENTQELTLDVTTTNGALFAVAPAIDDETGALTYTPTGNANGSATVTVSLSDNGTTNGVADPKTTEATFTITVTEVNDAPVFTLPEDADQTVAEDAGAQSVANFYTAAGPGGGDDENTQELTLDVTTTNGALFAVAPAIDDETGALTYTPAGNANGSATVTVSLSDNGGTEDGGADTTEATFTILVTEVNDAPVFTLPEDADQTVAEDAGAQSVANFYTAAGPGGGDDENTQELTLDVTTTNGALFAVAPAIDDETGALTYTPADNANGSATVTVSLSDNGTTNGEPAGETTEATFTILVTEVNDAPVFTLPEDADQTVAEDAGAQSVANFYTAAGPGGGDDEAGQTLTLDVTSTNGALFAVAPAIDDETGVLTYTPADNANGQSTVTVSLSDNGTTNSVADPKTTSVDFTIDVTPVNDTPGFVASDQTVTEDEGDVSIPLVSWLVAVDDGDPTFTAADIQTVSFAVTDVSDPSSFTDGPSIDDEGDLVFTLADDANGDVDVQITATDDGGTDNGGDNDTVRTITITIDPINDAPEFAVTDQSVPEDNGPTVIDNADWIDGPDDGDDWDSEVDDQTVTTTITDVSDPDLFAAGPAIVEGDLTFTPADDAHGEAVIEITATDDGGTENEGDDDTTVDTFTITIDPINDAPEFAVTDQSVPEDNGPTVIDNADWIDGPDDGDDWDSDVDDQTVTVAITDVSDPDLFAAGPAIVEGDLTFTPADDAHGEAVIEITATDDGGTENEGDDDTTVDTLTITIDPVNDAPVALDDEYSTTEDIGFTVDTEDGLLVADDDDYDVDEDEIEVVAETVVTAEGGSAALAADGSFSYAPPSGFFGADTFTYTVTDGVATSAPATVTILVTEDDGCAALAPLPFTDVPAGAFYEAAVQWAVSCGVTSGFTPTSFGPQVSVNRAQFLTFLWRAAGEPVPTGGENFTDVNPGDYFYDAVRWAVNVENPVTTGTTTTTFSPELTINRAQAMTLLHRYVGSPTPAGGENFTDVNPGDFFYDAVRWAVNADSPVTSGTTATTFSPANQATRAEALTFIYRAIG